MTGTGGVSGGGGGVAVGHETTTVNDKWAVGPKILWTEYPMVAEPGCPCAVTSTAPSVPPPACAKAALTMLGALFVRPPTPVSSRTPAGRFGRMVASW